MKKAFLTALTLAVTLSSLSTPALAAKAPPPALTTITTDQNAETFTNSDPNRLVLGDGFGGQGRVIFDYATGELTFDHCNLDKMLGYHEAKVQGRHVSGVDPSCQVAPTVTVTVGVPFGANNPETLDIPVTWNPAPQIKATHSAEWNGLWDCTTDYRRLNRVGTSASTSPFPSGTTPSVSVRGITDFTKAFNFGFPVIVNNVSSSATYRLSIPRDYSTEGVPYTFVPMRYQGGDARYHETSIYQHNKGSVGFTDYMEDCCCGGGVQWNNGPWNYVRWDGGITSSLPLVRNDKLGINLFGNPFRPVYTNADEASSSNFLNDGLCIDPSTRSIVFPSSSGSAQAYTEKLYSTALYYFTMEPVNTSVTFSKEELDSLYDRNMSLPGTASRGITVSLANSLKPIPSYFSALPHSERTIEYSKYYRGACTNGSPLDTGYRLIAVDSCAGTAQPHNHRRYYTHINVRTFDSPAGPSTWIEREANFDAYLRYVPRDAAPVSYHPFTNFSDTRDSTIKSVVFKGCSSTISFPRTDTKSVSGYTDTANIWGWMNDVPVTIEGGKYETVNLPAALVTSGNFASGSHFITDGDSTSETANGRTTVKLTNPPIIIDWGEFPGLDIDLSAPTIFFEVEQLRA